jgi:hypothetical protein
MLIIIINTAIYYINALNPYNLHIPYKLQFLINIFFPYKLYNLYNLHPL